MEILCYTREPLEDMLYAEKLAYSMHLAWRRDGEKVFRPFHHNEGLLYAKAVQREDGTLAAKSLRAPQLFPRKGGGYGVVAFRTESDGGPDPESEGRVLLWESDDLVRYREIGLISAQEAEALLDGSGADGVLGGEVSGGGGFSGGADGVPGGAVSGGGVFSGGTDGAPGGAVSGGVAQEAISGIEGCVPGNILHIPDELGEYLLKKLTTPVCEKIVLSEAPGRNTAEAGAEAERPGEDAGAEAERPGENAGAAGADAGRHNRGDVCALAYYSDGTMLERKIDWDAEDGKEQKACGRGRTGRIHQEHFPFPFAEHRADPCCMYWHGKYYFIATNDADDNHTLYIRCADTLEGVQSAPETLLLDSVTHPGIGGLLWAPEFHEIGGKMYIFHAATEGEFFREESRVMELREGGDPMCREDWSAPHLVVRKDGSPLCEAGKVISLDMTTFEYEGGVYAMWSQRQFLPVDQGAWLYLARIDEREPWKLVSDPVCVALPDYGWENNHTFVVEGPYALWRDGQLMVTYSGAAVDATYAVGLLKPVMGSDILKPENWRKSNFPLLSSRSVPGEFGPGHNSYVTDENGLVWNFYHARPGVDGPRSSCARRVHFDIDGEPMLDVTEEQDFPEGLELPEGLARL